MAPALLTVCIVAALVITVLSFEIFSLNSRVRRLELMMIGLDTHVRNLNHLTSIQQRRINGQEEHAQRCVELNRYT